MLRITQQTPLLAFINEKVVAKLKGWLVGSDSWCADGRNAHGYICWICHAINTKGD
jgi:hypothetical protein